MKHWTESKVIRYLFATWFASFLMALVPMLERHSVDWWALGAQAITSLAAIIIRMFADDVEGPLKFMNKDQKP